MNLRRALFVTVLALTAAGSVAYAHSDATGIVKERMEAMMAIGKATKSIVGMIRGGEEYDAEAVAAAAAAIEGHADETLLSKFPEGSLDAPSEALPLIWEEWAEFKSYFEDMRREAALLQTVAENGPDGFGETVDYAEDPTQPAGVVATRLLKTCKTCHDKFRQED